MDNNTRIRKYARAYQLIEERYLLRHIDQLTPKELLRQIRNLLEYQFLSHYAAAPPGWRLLLRRFNHDRPLPEFAVVGPIKSGSSDLVSHILLHPNIVPPLAKEISSPEPEDWRPFYPTARERRSVERRQGRVISGFLSPFLHAIRLTERFHEACPNAKIVIVLRNPVQRAYSHWKWDVLLGGKGNQSVSYYRDFATFVETALEVFPEMEMDSLCGFPFLESGIYYKPVQRWMARFGHTQVMVLNIDEYFGNRGTVLEKIQRFLNLPIVPLDTGSPPINRNPLRREPMDGRTRKALEDFYRPFNEKLYTLLGSRFEW